MKCILNWDNWKHDGLKYEGWRRDEFKIEIDMWDLVRVEDDHEYTNFGDRTSRITTILWIGMKNVVFVHNSRIV